VKTTLKQELNMDPVRKIDQFGEVGDKVGEKIGTVVRFLGKNALYFGIVAVMGILVFLSSVVYSAWKKKT
jgi:hypothetical protein